MKQLLLCVFILISFSAYCQNESETQANRNTISDFANKQFIWANGSGEELFIGISNDQGVYRLSDNIITYSDTEKRMHVVCKLSYSDSKVYFLKPDMLVSLAANIQEVQDERTPVYGGSQNYDIAVAANVKTLAVQHRHKSSDTIAILNESEQLISVMQYGNFNIIDEKDGYAFSSSTERLLDVKDIDKKLAIFFFINEYLPKGDLRETIKKITRTQHK